MAEAYIAEGSIGKTYGISTGDSVYIMIEWSENNLSDPQEMTSWSLARWKGQLGAERVALDALPQELQEMA